jgi:ferredoxin
VDEQVFFRLTGARSSAALGPVDGLRPALFARFGDLTKLRYDFPLVLLASESGERFVATLSGLIDDVLVDAAPKGLAGERMRRSVLRLEREIRAMLARGEQGLAQMWVLAEARLAERGGAPVIEDLSRARQALAVDGDLVACDAAAPSRLVEHVWRAEQARKTSTMRRTIDALALRLSDLVKADHLRSGVGRQATTLRAGVGGEHQGLFDFELMARLLSAPSGASALSDRRRARIEGTLAVLRAQRFFDASTPFAFAFERVETALEAYRERTSAQAELIRAIAVAELELGGSYVEGKHDEFFARFDARALGPADRALFPDYLVRLGPGASDAEGRARLIEGLTSDAPLKILFTTDDALGIGAQLATTAMSLGDAFVLQTSASQLYVARDGVRAAMAFPGPALLSVFAPARHPAGLDPYLVAAAATESRAFPTFSYDPSAGTGWAQRLRLHDVPQPDRVWPEHTLSYADERLQRVTERVAFTLADLAVCDPSWWSHLARVARDRWSDQLVPMARWLDGAADGEVPFVYAIDGEAGLHRLAVDDRLAELTRHCAEAWGRLRELDGLKGVRAAGVAALAPAAALAAEPAAVASGAMPAAAPVAAVADASGPATDEPYIETPRCTTCNECTGVNPRMFAYNENKQAYIKDPKAGTFKDLVEAAESCQVAIIHPGKPRDPNEPGLDELLKRAEPFR